jgi:hypothetical protein
MTDDAIRWCGVCGKRRAYRAATICTTCAEAGHPHPPPRADEPRPRPWRWYRSALALEIRDRLADLLEGRGGVYLAFVAGVGWHALWSWAWSL